MVMPLTFGKILIAVLGSTLLVICLYMYSTDINQRIFSGIVVPRNGLLNVSPSMRVSRSLKKSNSESETTPAATTRDKSLNDYSNAKDGLKSLLSLIWYRYELHDTYGHNFFNAANNLGKKTWDLLKYKFAHKIVSPLIASKNATFFMLFTGSSVTAGHDSYYHQSYPLIFKSRMEKIFADLGIELIVHNIAQGANNCSPYVLCYESMGGLDPDFVNWEQSYNCGHDDPIFEAAARVAGRSSGRGGVVYYSASGAWSPSDCPLAVENPPYCAEEWTPAAAGLEEWSPTSDELDAVRESLFSFHQSKPSYNRFAGSFRNDYPGIGFHGFNVWEENPKCKWKKDGLDRVGCNGIDAAGKCAMKFMSKEASLYGSENGKGANWHPTRAFHMLRGEAIAWLYALILRETVAMVEEDLATHSRADLAEKYWAQLTSMTPKLPHAKRCDQHYHCNIRPFCHTDYRPHFPADMTLSELVVGHTDWEYDPVDPSEWTEKYGYPDAKPLYRAHGSQAGELHLRVHVGSGHQFLWICGEKKESIMHLTIYLDKDVKDPDPDGGNPSKTLKESYTPSSSRVPWTSHKNMGNECMELFGLPDGDHVISVSTSSAQPDHTSAVTHLIMW